MAIINGLTKKQVSSIYMFKVEYDKSIRGCHNIDSVLIFALYGVGHDDIMKIRDSIKEEERFTFAIKNLKEVQNKKVFRILYDSCYRMLNDMLEHERMSIERYMIEYKRLQELFRREFNYYHL